MTKLEMQASIMADHQKAWNAGQTCLWNVYGTFSAKKEAAFDRCRQIRYKMHGYQGAIVRHSGWRFSYGFYYDVIDEETGEVKEQRFCYITYAGEFSSDYDTWTVQKYV